MLISGEAMRAAVGTKGRAVEVLHHAQDLLCGLASPPASFAATGSEGAHKEPGHDIRSLSLISIVITAGQNLAFI